MSKNIEGMPPVMESSAADEEYIQKMNETLDLKFDPVQGTVPQTGARDEKFFNQGVNISKIGGQQIPAGSHQDTSQELFINQRDMGDLFSRQNNNMSQRRGGSGERSY